MKDVKDIASPTELKNGYTVLDGGPERVRDNLMPASKNLVQTDNGGFLGRVESTGSDNDKA